MSRYPHFVEALRKLEPTSTLRAQRLGVSRRSLFYYQRGDHLPPIEIIKREPTLDEALSRDLELLNVDMLAEMAA